MITNLQTSNENILVICQLLCCRNVLMRVANRKQANSARCEVDCSVGLHMIQSEGRRLQTGRQMAATQETRISS
jgi:hypothetical protein